MYQARKREPYCYFFNVFKAAILLGSFFNTSLAIDIASFLVDVLPIAKARGFWDTDEPCYQMTVLRVLSAMDNALPIFIV